MNGDIFDDVSDSIFYDDDEYEFDDLHEQYLRGLERLVQTREGKFVMSCLLKKFRLYKLSSGRTAEITARREGVRGCALLLFEELKEVAPDELEEIISMTL